MMCFLEDEAENVGDKPSFASGVLAQFMTSTKTISDAAEAYGDSVRSAKTESIRENDKCDPGLRGPGGQGGFGSRCKPRALQALLNPLETQFFNPILTPFAPDPCGHQIDRLVKHDCLRVTRFKSSPE